MDVYDVCRYVWCSLCQSEHEPCETHPDGIEYYFPPEEDES